MKSPKSEYPDKNKIINEPQWVEGYLDITNNVSPEYNNHEIFISREDIWWNQGNETKPNFTEFQQMGWDKLPETTSFKSTSELSALATITKDHIKRLFKVVISYPDQFPNPPKDPVINYYYVSKVFNYSGQTLAKVELEIDLWTTYFLSKPFPLMTNRLNCDWDFKGNRDKKVRRPFVLDLPKLQTTSIDPFLYLLSYDDGLIDPGFYSKFTINDKFAGDINKIPKKFRYQDLMTYYVFRERTTEKNPFTRTHTVLFPVLFERADDNDKKITLSDLDVSKCFYRDENTITVNGSTGTAQAHKIYLNSTKNLDKLINESKTNKDIGIGDFLGIYVGPNIFNTKKTIKDHLIYLYYQNNVKWSEIDGTEFIPWKMNFEGVPGGSTQPSYNVFGFFTLRLENTGLNLRGYGEIKWEYIKEISSASSTIWNQEGGTKTLFSKTLGFYDGFVYFSNFGEFYKNTEINSLTDTYYDWLKASKINRDNQISIINQQMGLSLFNNISSNILNPNPLGLIGSSLNTSVQFSNTFRTLRAQEAQARVSSNNLIKTTDRIFANEWNYINGEFNNYFSLGTISNSIISDPNDGYHNHKWHLCYGLNQNVDIKLINYYGLQTEFWKTESDSQEAKSGYFCFNEEISLILVPEKLNNQIRGLLIQMLKNGVRIATKAEVQNGFK